MRNSRSWKTDLVKSIERHSTNAHVLCDVELALTLVAEVCPGEPPSVVPALLSANPIPELNPTALSDSCRRMLACARVWLRYCQGETRWQGMLKSYEAESELVRMYDVGGCGPAKPRESSICPDRHDIYIAALNSPPPYANRTTSMAGSGTYRVPIREDGKGGPQWHSVSFTEEEIQSVPKVEARPLSPPRQRQPLKIPWAALMKTADWMDRCCDGNWRDRMRKMHIVGLDFQGDGNPQHLKLDGRFHLVGMVSSGKSTLMDIIAVWGAKLGLRIMLVVGDNVDVTTRVEGFRKFGLNSVPLMGIGDRGRKRRREQIERVAMSKSDYSDEAWKDSRLKWVSPICPIIGFGHSDLSDIPSGSEPCDNLYEREDLQSDRRTCPLMSACPAHLARNRMMEADIWVGTPQSLVLTRAPAQAIEDNTRLLETVYRECDLVIVDEADKVQTQLDEVFAPAVSLIDTRGNGLMERLDRDAAAPAGRSLSKTVESADVLDWSTAQRVGQQAANVLLHLCSSHSKLRKWVTQREYFTAFGLANQLHIELAQLDSRDAMPEMPDEIIDFLREPDSESSLQRLAMAVMWNLNKENMLAHEEAMRWLRELYPGETVDGQDNGLLQLKLQAITLAAFLNHRLARVFDSWEVGKEAYSLNTDADLPFRRPPRDYAALVPTSPAGNLFGFRYKREYDGEIDMFRCTGVGRWVLTHLHDMFQDLDGAFGPHVILLSGSSWAPGSTSYHVQVPVDGVLSQPDDMVKAISGSTAFFNYAWDPHRQVPVRISGTSGDMRQRNLEILLKFLSDESNGKSHIQRELETLEKTDAGGNCLLMVTGSYDETRQTYKFLGGRVDCGIRYLTRDTDEDEDKWNNGSGLRRGLVSEFASDSARILIAPLMAIERGHNIVDKAGRAVIGSVYFLVRPMPVPQQLSSAIRDMNHWAVKKWEQVENEEGLDSVQTGWHRYRKYAHRAWHDILRDPGRFRNATPDRRRNLVWTQLVALWQAVGRGVRGGSSVRVHFCDAAFAPETAEGRIDSEETSMLVAMRTELNRYLQPSADIDEREQKVCRDLYTPWADMLSKIRNLDE